MLIKNNLMRFHSLSPVSGHTKVASEQLDEEMNNTSNININNKVPL